MVAGYRQLIAGDAEIRDQVEEIEEALPEMMECKPFFDKLMQTTQRIFIPPEYEESRSRLRAVLEAAGGTALEKSAEDLERQANGVSENIESTTAISWDGLLVQLAFAKEGLKRLRPGEGTHRHDHRGRETARRTAMQY